ncbi:MAG: hypothetical protein NC394_09180 [Bacteroides sp.]|nr:hypothetical protein [Bacteroides sp.]
MKINIRKNKKQLKNKLYRGLGMISGNNSSRLLLDYRLEHPQSYRRIMRLVFGKEGLNVCHLKVELGADINSSSGTEPCTMRSREEYPDVRRGAAFILAADARRINPELTLDMLYWSEPKWVTDSADIFAARYKWFKDTLNAAYKEFKIKFDFVSPNRNERAVEPEWIKYFAKRLKEETDCLYDFSKIKIVAADEEGSWRIADLMLEDKDLLSAVDVVGSHYTSHGTEITRLLSDKYGKEIWFSEGSPPMSYSKGTSRFDKSGLSGINGALDIADRIIAMYPCGCMTLYEFQPLVAAYYDGVTYGYKQLLTAKEPWSGHFEADSGFYTALHFARFIKKGWAFADSACVCDGEKGGDGHAIVNAKKSFLSAYDTVTGDYSVVICNSADTERVLDITVEELEKACQAVDIWETRGASKSEFDRIYFGKAKGTDKSEFDENYFRMIGTAAPVKAENGYKLRITVKPYSLVTLSTLKTERPDVRAAGSRLLPLPYCDDFNYSESRLRLTSGTPRYTTDQGGAFETTELNGERVLMQKITPAEKAEEWGATPQPVTSFGDDRWFNYSVSADVLLEQSDRPKENYAGVGLRYSSACQGVSGYSLLMYQNGEAVFRKNDIVCSSYVLRELDMSKPHRLKLSACYDRVESFIDGERLGARGESVNWLSAGRAAFYSSYNKNIFKAFKAEKIDGVPPYVKRFDDTDPEFTYYGSWEHKMMSGFSDYKRTFSEGKAGASVKLAFSGTGFALFGENADSAVFMLILDGKKLENAPIDISELSISKMKLTAEAEEMNRQLFENQCVLCAENRQHFFSVRDLQNKRHTAELVILRGKLRIDGAEAYIY